jgi:hypothetical protein
MLKKHWEDLALDLLPFSDMGQVLPLDVLRQVAGCIKFFEAFYFKVIW